jgi:hypothetical protein
MLLSRYRSAAALPLRPCPPLLATLTASRDHPDSDHDLSPLTLLLPNPPRAAHGTSSIRLLREPSRAD